MREWQQRKLASWLRGVVLVILALVRTSAVVCVQLLTGTCEPSLWAALLLLLLC